MGGTFINFCEVANVQGRQFDPSVIVLCVRWYLGYNLSLRDLKEMMSERSIGVDPFDDPSLGRPCADGLA